MPPFIGRLLVRHEPPVNFASNLKAGVGAALGMVFVAWLATVTGLPLLLAPLGATAALLFGQPSSPLSQPINVMAGYLVGTVICEAAFLVFPGDFTAASLSVGLTIVVTRWLRVTHPPACALPIMAFGGVVHGLNLFMVVFVSCVVLVSIAMAVHRIPPRRDYPHH